MHKIFGPHLRKFVLVFFHDFLIYSVIMEAYLQHLTKVFKLLRANKLFTKLSKCSFAEAQAEFLGHIIFGQCVSTDPGKVEAIVNWPCPKKIKELKGFLRLTCCYRRFIQRFAISKPLIELHKKGGFNWNNQAASVVDELKNAMIQALVLALPDFSVLT